MLKYIEKTGQEDDYSHYDIDFIDETGFIHRFSISYSVIKDSFLWRCQFDPKSRDGQLTRLRNAIRLFKALGCTTDLSIDNDSFTVDLLKSSDCKGTVISFDGLFRFDVRV